MRDLNIKIINIRRTYDIAMSNILKVAYKEFHRVLDGKGVFKLPSPFRLSSLSNEVVITKIWTSGEDVWVENSNGLQGKLNTLHQDDQANLYTSLITILR